MSETDPFHGPDRQRGRARTAARRAAPAQPRLPPARPRPATASPPTRGASRAALAGLPERTLEGGHPDLLEVRPEGTQIRIDQVRELWHDIQLRPFSAERRVYLIWDAETMPEVVQNALLKSIEEPPAHAVVILVCCRSRTACSQPCARAARPCASRRSPPPRSRRSSGSAAPPALRSRARAAAISSAPAS